MNSQRPVSLQVSGFQKEIKRQFECYFLNANFEFSLPIYRKGTIHQEKVWNCLSDIPTGKVLTYGQVAQQIGSSAQAIGNACRHNPIPVIVPCHRVVAASDIGGFSGATGGVLLNIKKTLLQHEGVIY